MKVRKGITDKQIEQLVEYTQSDEAVRRFTSDAERFGDRESFGKWYNRGKEVYVMDDGEGNLLGLIWFSGEAKKPVYSHTFGLRLYGEARGKGLALGFMETVFSMFEQNNPGVTGYWLEAFDNNLPAIAVYTKFGFKKSSPPDENNRVLMLFAGKRYG